MKLGNKIYPILILLMTYIDFSIAEEKIVTSPLINLKEIKPSFETLDEENDNYSSNKNLREKKK